MTPKHVLLAVLIGLLGVVPAQAGDLPVVYTGFLVGETSCVFGSSILTHYHSEAVSMEGGS